MDICGKRLSLAIFVWWPPICTYRHHWNIVFYIQKIHSMHIVYIHICIHAFYGSKSIPIRLLKKVRMHRRLWTLLVGQGGTTCTPVEYVTSIGGQKKSCCKGVNEEENKQTWKKQLGYFFGAWPWLLPKRQNKGSYGRNPAPLEMYKSPVNDGGFSISTG